MEKPPRPQLITHLILNGVSPEDALALIMEVHSDSHSSVLGSDQGPEVVSMDVPDE